MAAFQSMQCPGCGANITTEKDYCEYCGSKLSWPKSEADKPDQAPQPQISTYQPSQSSQETSSVYKTTSGVAIASLVCALLGLSPVALVLGIIGVAVTSKPDSAATGKGLAIAGIVISVLQIVVWIMIVAINA